MNIYTIVTGFSDSYPFLKNNEKAYSLFKDNICFALISCACLLIFCFIAKFMVLFDCEYLSFALTTFILFCVTALIVFATREFITIFKIKKTPRIKNEID